MSEATSGPAWSPEFSTLDVANVFPTEKSDSECLNQAARAITRHLKLSSESLIVDNLALRDYHEGEHITTQNDLDHVNQLYYIVWGESAR